MPAEKYHNVMSQPPEKRDLSGIPKEVQTMRLADGPTEKKTFSPEVTKQMDAIKDGLSYQAREGCERSRASDGTTNH